MTSRATIIGGGIVGLSSAIALARRGMDVTVIEGDTKRAAPSWGNAGHIAIEQVEPLASLSALRSAPRRLFSRGGALAFPPGQWATWLPFGWRLVQAAAPSRFARGKQALAELLATSMPAWQRLSASLPVDGLVRQDGHFVAWQDAAAAIRGRAAWAAADTGTAYHRDATEAELAMLGRLSGRTPAGAIRFENSGQITDLAALAGALEQALRDAGGRILSGKARLARDGTRATVSLDGAQVETPDQIVVAAGIGSTTLLAPFGIAAPLVAERGYHIRATDHDWPADMPPVVFEDRSMIVTGFAGCVQAASFVELGRPDAPPDPAKWARLERHVAELGLPMRPPFVRWMGARPTFPDYLPAIGRSRRADNLLYAFGHQHLGLTLGPVTGEIVAALMTGDRLPIDLAPFNIERFSRKGRPA